MTHTTQEHKIRRMPGTLQIETIESAVLRGNPFGDPARRRVAVWLPPSYQSSPHRRYPVIYWLAGYTGTGEMMFQGSPWQPGLGERLDRLTAQRHPPRRQPVSRLTVVRRLRDSPDRRGDPGD
jgi:hypothetical protein